MKQNSKEKDNVLANANRRHRRHQRHEEEMKARPGKATAADLAKWELVPLNVRLWLGRFIEKRDGAFAHAFIEHDDETMEQARLIYDVLYSKYLEMGDAKAFPEEARDYVEEYLYRLAQASDLQVWNDPDIAVAGLAALIECNETSLDGSAHRLALEIAIVRLTTRRERRDFLTRYNTDERYGRNDERERNTEAAFKLSRTLADPATSFETREELGHALREFSMSSGVTVEHPALARRAFQLMCEAKPKGIMRREAKRDRKRLLDLLDTITEKAKASDAE